MRRKYIFLLIGWLITIASFAAVPDKKPEKVLPVQEKVYLHFDNNCYFLGDTIWYKAYVIRDYRRTLYWNPNVTTDNFGQASIEFYNNSVCNIIDVSAEGITRYGQFLVNE